MKKNAFKNTIYVLITFEHVQVSQMFVFLFNGIFDFNVETNPIRNLTFHRKNESSMTKVRGQSNKAKNQKTKKNKKNQEKSKKIKKPKTQKNERNTTIF